MIKDLLTKKPFARILNAAGPTGSVTGSPAKASFPKETGLWQTYSQSDFLREFYPTGHKIHNSEYYPDLIKKDDKGQLYKQKVFRVSFPFQMIITTQHLIHLCGNDIRFELTDTKVNEGRESLFLEMQQGWLDHNMEIAFYEFAKSVKITGDGAIAYYLKDGKMGAANLSFLKGDRLFPHYDSLTNELVCFARTFSDYDEEGSEVTEWVEVWDSAYLSRYRKAKKGIKGAVSEVKDILGLEGYELAERAPHGFSEVPVVYHRNDDGPCWAFVQDNIDQYEMAISHLGQNNMAYAFPIMVLKGEQVEIQGDIYGAVKAITMGSEDDARYMTPAQSPESFKLQTDILLKAIFMGAFIVMPPEVKSGDLPGVAIKLIYSPSIEQAKKDAKEFDKSVDKMTRLFMHGYGVETGKPREFSSLKVFAFIEPYVHQNTAELINNLVQSANAGILSKQSASETTGYDRNNEWDRIVRELKQQQSMDLLYQPSASPQGEGGDD